MLKDVYFLIVIDCVSAAFGAVLQGSLFGLVGMLPQKYSAVFMSGQGLGGTFAALAMIFAIASETQCYFTIIEILL